MTQETRSQFRRVLCARLGLSPERTEAVLELLARRTADDDRRLCLECRNCTPISGRCKVAAAGRMPRVDRRFQPVPDLLQRCEFFAWSMP